MADFARDSLGEEQARLVAALTGDERSPEGFDPGRVGLVARTLINKRMRAVRKAWPGLVQSVGAEFDELFAAYARRHCAPDGGAAADAEGFSRHLGKIGRLGDEAFVELLARRVMRGFPVRVARLPRSGRRVLAVRVPWRGLWIFLGRGA
jgi:hypothetical protein